MGLGEWSWHNVVLSEAAGTAPSSSASVVAVVSSTAAAASAAASAASAPAASATPATTAIVASASPSSMSSTRSARSATSTAAAAAPSLALVAAQLHTHRLLSCFYQQGSHRVTSHPVQVYGIRPYILHHAPDWCPGAHNTQIAQPVPKCEIF